MSLARGFFSDPAAHINALELRAVLRAVQTFLHQKLLQLPLSWTRIKLRVDSQVAMHVILNTCSPSNHLMAEFRPLFWLLQARRILLLPDYIPSVDDVLPDALSRLPLHPDDIKLCPHTFRSLEWR